MKSPRLHLAFCFCVSSTFWDPQTFLCSCCFQVCFVFFASKGQSASLCPVVVCRVTSLCSPNTGITISQKRKKNLQLFLTVAQYRSGVYCSITLYAAAFHRTFLGEIKWNCKHLCFISGRKKCVFWSHSCPHLDRYHSQDCLMQY